MKLNGEWIGVRESTGERFPASVPGNIQCDYGIYKNFGDPNYGENAKQYLSLEGDFWQYETTFKKPLGQGRVEFSTGGIDYECEILLNGEKIFSHIGAYSPFRVDLTDRIKDENLLAVRIYPHPKRKGAPFGRDEADHSCKAPACYEWDWHPRLLSSGIWNGAEVEFVDRGTLSEVNVKCTLQKDFTSGIVSVAARCGEDVRFTLCDKGGKTVLAGGLGDHKIEDPHLWYPNGAGESYLYTYTLESSTDRVSGKVGFARSALEMNEGSWREPTDFPMSRSNPPAQLSVNGKKIFAKGSNFVNPDLFPGTVSRNHYETLVRMAHDANMNIFRCWGGAGVQKEDFYELCDAYGIMVWYEFPLACALYPDDDEYLAVLEGEARAILKMLTRHPSVRLLCGGNELFNNWSGMTDQSLPLRLLGKVCYEEARDLPFNPTSPLGGMAHGCYEFRFRGVEVYEMFGSAHATAYSEFGVPATPSAETLRRIIPEGEIFPPKDGGSWRYHHAFGAWIGDTWLCPSLLRDYFGEAQSLEELVDETQLLQSEGYKAIFEEARRQAPHCAMAVNWCYNEPWVCAANNSLLTFPAEPKPAYFAVKNSLSPVVPSAKLTKFVWQGGEEFFAELWLLNDSDEAVSDVVRASLEIGGEKIPLLSWETPVSAPGRNLRGHTVRVTLPEAAEGNFMTLRLTSSHGENEYTLRYRAKSAPVKKVKVLNQ